MDTFHLQVVLNSLLQEILLGVTLLYFAPCLYISFRGVGGGETPQVTIYKISVAKVDIMTPQGTLRTGKKCRQTISIFFQLYICTYAVIAFQPRLVTKAPSCQMHHVFWHLSLQTVTVRASDGRICHCKYRAERNAGTCQTATCSEATEPEQTKKKQTVLLNLPS